MKEFKLSEHEQVEGYFPKDKVKEFIKRLKEDIEFGIEHRKIIDKLAGDLKFDIIQKGGEK